ncbi:uncharacterized protein J4E78_003596 [Alternaria triticimaculans]|uniref:uncharacterized protein n=1 Tax=Alternaria triticimaculans TaxID=297637 RepID=UPI0020C2F64E|nr:uncharacterized protein J4E78_003596 [Alternaria triticimaculans]KAI4666129.1 hypothetical protein J4E78_003596 [Alternaria triticimaculans]
MLLSGIALLAGLLSSACAADIPEVLDCDLDGRGKVPEGCEAPIAPVAAVVPGSSYIAKIECKDCPYEDPEDHEVITGDNVLLLNVTLTHDNRTVLLNDRPLYPLPTIPTPSTFLVTRYRSNLSHAELYWGLNSEDPYCRESWSDRGRWCHEVPLTQAPRMYIDYLYITNPSDNQEGDDADAEYWSVALDVIGKSRYPDDPLWKFNNPEQKMLWVRVKGTPLKRGDKGGPAKVADPFGHSTTDDQIYEYQIVDVRLVARAYTFPLKKSLTIWGTIGHFLGSDVWELEGSRFLYRREEWGYYGKKGTLRDMFGEFVHWEWWGLFWVIFSSVVGGLFTIFLLWKMYRWIVAQRELMKWDGMEDVWENMRRDRVAEEEGALLNAHGAYRDDPDEGSSSRPPAYEDALKPLPSKPLPEKPLPAVPLIDA